MNRSLVLGKGNMETTGEQPTIKKTRTSKSKVFGKQPKICKNPQVIVRRGSENVDRESSEHGGKISKKEIIEDGDNLVDVNMGGNDFRDDVMGGNYIGDVVVGGNEIGEVVVDGNNVGVVDMGVNVVEDMNMGGNEVRDVGSGRNEFEDVVMGRNDVGTAAVVVPHSVAS
ncbi:hypothetical protein Scep_001721 [Stephania cephalantha]|uniref:Uncharacterized protein n=1 Tax=Stephania cephalantha TaxID=152367 RepID=A0AAP0LBC0_9MAGN